MPFTRPLPAREPPQPGESLTSYVSRHALAMGYERPKSIRSLLEGFPLPAHLDCLGRGPPLRALSRLLGQREESLADLTIHTYADRIVLVPRNEPPAESIDSKTAGRFFDFAQPRVCPACLDEPPAYERLLWQFRPIHTCARHRCLLLNRCPACQRRLAPNRLDVTGCRCRFDLRASPIVAISAEVGALDETIHSWLSRPVLLVAGMPVATCFWWMERLASAIQRTPIWTARVRHEQSLPVAVSEAAVAWLAAARILMREPGELGAFLNAFQGVAKHRGTTTGVSRRFGLLLREAAQLESLGYPGPASALRTYLVEHYDQGHLNSKVCLFRSEQHRRQVQERPWITQTAAARRLKVRPAAVGALVEQGFLTGRVTPAGEQGRTIGLVRRDSIDAFQQQQRTAFSVNQTAKKLGMARHCVLELIHAGAFPGAVRSRAGWRIPEKALQVSLNVYQNQPPLENKCEHWISLRHATRQFGSQGMNLVQVIQLVREGRLAARRELGKENYQGLFVDAKELGRLAISIHAERETCEGYSLQRLARVLVPSQPFKDVVLRKWIRADLLIAERRGNAWWIAPEEVGRFRATYCLAAEACRILNISRATLSRWELSSRVAPVYSRRTHPGAGASVYRREDIRRLAQ